MARLVEVSEMVRSTVKTVEPESVVSKRRRRRSAGSDSGKKNGDGWRRTTSDQILLNMSTRLGAISQRQAVKYVYDTTEKNVQRRVQFMVEAGLLQRIDTLPWAGTVLWPTRAGRIVGVGEDSPLVEMEPPSITTMLHRLLVAEEALKASLVHHRAVFTEREIQVCQARGGDYLYRMLEDAGVRRSAGGTAGVVPTKTFADLDGRGRREIEAWLVVPMPHGDTDVRSPDFIEVTERGTLRAVEVELTAKANQRTRNILASYRDCVTGHGEVMRGQGWTLQKAKQHLRQFESVRWVCTHPVYDLLRGPEGGINPMTHKPDKGMVREVWDESLSSFLFFEKPDTWKLDKTRWPISCELIDIAHDPGLEYELLQRSLPPTYRCSYSAWRKWRRIWKTDVAGDTNPVGFEQWLRFPGNYRRCLEAAGR